MDIRVAHRATKLGYLVRVPVWFMMAASIPVQDLEADLNGWNKSLHLLQAIVAPAVLAHVLDCTQFPLINKFGTLFFLRKIQTFFCSGLGWVCNLLWPSYCPCGGLALCSRPRGSLQPLGTMTLSLLIDDCWSSRAFEIWISDNTFSCWKLVVQIRVTARWICWICYVCCLDQVSLQRACGFTNSMW